MGMVTVPAEKAGEVAWGRCVDAFEAAGIAYRNRMDGATGLFVMDVDNVPLARRILAENRVGTVLRARWYTPRKGGAPGRPDRYGARLVIAGRHRKVWICDITPPGASDNARRANAALMIRVRREPGVRPTEIVDLHFTPEELAGVAEIESLWAAYRPGDDD